ncbi:hypothetical protein [Oerskovia enterophila]|uniref:hypothetical protein n=1 Tax=Oerskovia enterophila TaxID=43678 RepID=UPI0008385058|nr:hypothetical protein [Oerskovia enterophila]
MSCAIRAVADARLPQLGQVLSWGADHGRSSPQGVAGTASLLHECRRRVRAINHGYRGLGMIRSAPHASVPEMVHFISDPNTWASHDGQHSAACRKAVVAVMT